MAGAGPPLHTFVSTKSIEVPKTLINGEKFIKWDEVSPEFNFFIIVYLYD